MNEKKLIESSEKVLQYSLLAILILATLAFSFVFFINWEDWFFGAKLDGLPAGLYLLIKAISALALATLLIKLPKFRTATALLSVAFFGFLFVDSAITIQKNSAGRESFSILLALFLIIPVLYLIVHLIFARITPRLGPDIAKIDPDTAGLPVIEERKQPLSPGILVAGVIIALVIGVFVLMPVTLSLLAPHVPFIADLGAPPAQDTIITKINPGGTMAWQTMLSGYSLDLVQVKTFSECGYLVYGTYWIAGKPGPKARAVNLDCRGNITWDYSQTLERGAQMPGAIQSVDPVHDGYLIKLDTGKVLWLDGKGNLRNNPAGDQSEILSAAGTDAPVAFYPSSLPAPTVSIRIRSEGESGIMFTVEDTLHHKDIQSVYSVNPSPDGSYLVFASVRA
jgi:hypothetical protein